LDYIIFFEEKKLTKKNHSLRRCVRIGSSSCPHPTKGSSRCELFSKLKKKKTQRKKKFIFFATEKLVCLSLYRIRKKALTTTKLHCVSSDADPCSLFIGFEFRILNFEFRSVFSFARYVTRRKKKQENNR